MPYQCLHLDWTSLPSVRCRQLIQDAVQGPRDAPIGVVGPEPSQV